MARHQRRTILAATLALVGVWFLTGAGWTLARHAKATAEKVAVHLHDIDLATLAPDQRTQALQRVSREMAELPVDERRKARLDVGWGAWFAAMTDEEKSTFLDN